MTEVKLELDGQFGYGMVMGDSPRRAMAVALVDAALRKNDLVARQLEQKLTELQQQLQRNYQHLYSIAATTRVNFEIL